MKYLVLGLALCSMLLAGCNTAKVEAVYLLGDTDLACVAWVDHLHLAVLLLDPQVVKEYASYSHLDAAMAAVHLLGIPSSAVVHVDSDAFDSFRESVVTLAATARDVPATQVDAQLCLEVLTDGAAYLRKTLLADTLASITGSNDPFGELETVKQATVFDVRSSLAITQNTDWEQLRVHLKRYIEEIQRFQRKE